jgi:hypothetical protein
MKPWGEILRAFLFLVNTRLERLGEPRNTRNTRKREEKSPHGETRRPEDTVDHGWRREEWRGSPAPPAEYLSTQRTQRKSVEGRREKPLFYLPALCVKIFVSWCDVLLEGATPVLSPAEGPLPPSYHAQAAPTARRPPTLRGGFAREQPSALKSSDSGRKPRNTKHTEKRRGAY